MKKVKRIVALLIAVIMLVGLLSACVKPDGKPTITIGVAGTTLEVGGDGIPVAVVSSDGGTVTLSVDSSLVEITSDNVLKIKSGVTVSNDVPFTLTATLDSDPTVTATKQFTVKVPSLKPEINLVASGKEMGVNDVITFAAVSSDKGSITLKVTGPNAHLVKLNGNFLTVVGTVTMDTDVTVVATLDSDPTVTAQKVITIHPEATGDTWIKIKADRYNIDSENYAVLTVTSSIKDAAYTVNCSVNSCVTYNNSSGKLSVYRDVETPTEITVTATLNDYPTISDTIKITVVPPVLPPSITISTDNNVDMVEKNKDLELNIEVTSDEAYDLEVSNKSLVTVVTNQGKNYLSVISDDIKYDTTVVVTATLRSDPSIKATKSFVVKAPRKDGVVQGAISKLTTETFNTMGSASLTVSGDLTDYYEDYKQPKNNSETHYDVLVKMEDGKWFGQWNESTKKDNVNQSSYVKSEETVTINGQSGHIMKKVYISKDNVLAYANITDYQSVPTLWENQHLWNHFGMDNVDNYTYRDKQSNADFDIYEFTADKTTEWAAYYLTYLSFAYTPLLEDTLDRVYLKVNSDNEIIGLIGYTEYLYYGADTREDADAMTYTRIELVFENVGATTVEIPDVYNAPEHADKLQAALNNMKTATNYTFKAVDTTTHAPSTDDGDYSYETVNNFGIQTLSVSGNYTSSQSPMGNGEVGLQGLVTNDAILFEKTSKYNYTQDGKNFRVEYTGYKAKKIGDDDYYDYFEYNSDTSGFEGKSQTKGVMSSVLPKWNFSVNIFEFVKLGTNNGVTTYEFRLRDSAITRDVAMQMSMHTNARDGSTSAMNRLSIVVDDNGLVLTTSYPYSITQGTYMGYITTTFSDVGTTEIDEKEFEDYNPRVISPLWANYKLMYYYPGHSTQAVPEPDATGATILQIMFKDNWTNFPPMTVFTDAFGDRMSNLFFEWREVVDANGNVAGYEDYFSMSADTDDYDENMQITNATYDRIINALKDGLEKYGFIVSYESLVHDAADRNNRYVSFVNEELNCQIVVMNNHTKNFFIDVGYFGDWSF